VAAPGIAARAPAAPAPSSAAVAPRPPADPPTAQEPAVVAPPTVLEAPEPPGPAGGGDSGAAAPQVSATPAAGASTIDAGPSLWALVPLIAMGLILFGGSVAVVVHEVRRRRQPVEL
ncbi:MAG TPA: hypothetical protein VM263_07250, partial [Acidimicrobiales bacterium]|nr:hypothetical protein [Acidimicrobiales bacterium]